jgi:hypothetical protein
LHRDELTAERFPLDPFGTEPGARLYRSGDLARWRTDGQIEFLGRRDLQVKVRGFRIELGEVESALNAHPRVGGSAVVVREDDPGDRRLVAYATPAPGASPPGADELREHLRAVLPEHMVPAAFVVLDTLPLTPNGKVDRAALPVPDASRGSSTAAAFVSPVGQLERQIAQVWAELLRVDAVGATDNFFDLGGNSLLLARACTMLRQRLNREIAIAELFQHATVRALARHLGGGDDAAQPSGGEQRERAQSRRTAAEDLRALKRTGRRDRPVSE